MIRLLGVEKKFKTKKIQKEWKKKTQNKTNHKHMKYQVDQEPPFSLQSPITSHSWLADVSGLLKHHVASRIRLGLKKKKQQQPDNDKVLH